MNIHLPAILAFPRVQGFDANDSYDMTIDYIVSLERFTGKFAGHVSETIRFPIKHLGFQGDLCFAHQPIVGW